MKNKFDIAELLLIKNLVEDKMEELQNDEYSKHTKAILESTLEKLNNHLESNK